MEVNTGNQFQRESVSERRCHSSCPSFLQPRKFYVFFFSSSNLRERSSKSMSSEAEELAPADAVGSVSGTDGNSGSTKLSKVLGAPALGLGEASGLGSGPVYNKRSITAPHHQHTLTGPNRAPTKEWSFQQQAVPVGFPEQPLIPKVS